MSREKQIEEMTETINDLYGADAMYYGVDSYGIATALYNAGYRKQSEGEWVKHGYKWQCTKCKVLMDIDGTPKENLLNYCPNCGAKMKGGE